MPSDLWSFALATYARPGVEAACLQLQEEGADVCLLLCALWLESRNTGYDSGYAGSLRAIAQPWQNDVVAPLRELRRAWRDRARKDVQLAGWRERVKTLELEAERELLSRLEDCASAWPTDVKDSARWLEALSEGQAKKNRDALQVLRAAVSFD
ncbi:TIGR02444 family protein [Pseudomonas sp. LRF_L74]|uniref:TIGR02444 family protein n=1 Tax=Pseudomonas sp. LRF_L74 TaxID=3369422 RepID=UPI003F63A0A2